MLGNARYSHEMLHTLPQRVHANQLMSSTLAGTVPTVAAPVKKGQHCLCGIVPTAFVPKAFPIGEVTLPKFP